MPLKIQNYGEWKGDGPGGHHPPACTCYRCNEQRQAEEAAQEEGRRVAEYDRRVTENRERARTKTGEDATHDVGGTAETGASDAPERRPPTAKRDTNGPGGAVIPPHQGSTEIARSHPKLCKCGICTTDRRLEEARLRQTDDPPSPRLNTRATERARTGSRQRATEAVRQSVEGARPTTSSKTTSRRVRSARHESKVFRISRAITASALRYALALHAAAVVGLMVYALAQGGPSDVLPTLDTAAEAYVLAWRTMGTMMSQG